MEKVLGSSPGGEALARGSSVMEQRRRAAVVVLGDYGRSPRMQYHSLSLARQAGMEVDVIAYAGALPHKAVLENPRIHLHLLNPPPFNAFTGLFRILLLPVKALLQFVTLAWWVFRVPAPDFFLVQNPPSVPTLAVVKMASWFRKSTFIIDWHNFGYTLLGLSLGSQHFFVTIYRLYEKCFGQMADVHLCVTKAMQQTLAESWSIRATVLYDKPPEFFRPTSLGERHELFLRLDDALRKPLGSWDCCSQNPNGYAQDEATLFTCRRVRVEDSASKPEIQETDQVAYIKARPALLVSSTSWTVDEDFGILLEAAVLYDRRVSAALKERDEEATPHTLTEGSLYPRLLFIITGKGPMREDYERRISRLRLRRVAFRTMWLPAEDYPRLLGSADLGISLHTSSSGLDLPMKVVDMFGCGLPVAAASYSCINELVKDGENGVLFSSSRQLAEHFLNLFRGFPDHCQSLGGLRDGASASGRAGKWYSEWEQNVAPLLAVSRESNQKQARRV